MEIWKGGVTATQYKAMSKNALIGSAVSFGKALLNTPYSLNLIDDQLAKTVGNSTPKMPGQATPPKPAWLRSLSDPLVR